MSNYWKMGDGFENEGPMNETGRTWSPLTLKAVNTVNILVQKQQGAIG